MKERPKIGLALGGGGARGIAHVGILKVLEREGIPIDMIVGTSIGALVGAAYAINPDAIVMEKRVSKVLDNKGKESKGLRLLGRAQWDGDFKSDFLSRVIRIALKEMFLSYAMFKNSLLSENDLRACVEAFLDDIKIDDTTIPFAATAVDLVSGRQVLLSEGPIIQAVMASCAVPGFMPTIAWNEMILVDGGIVDFVPAGPLKNLGPEVVIGVDVGSYLDGCCAIEDGIDAMHRSMEVMSFFLNRHCKKNVDIMIEPAVGDIPWTDFLKYKEIIHIGEIAAESKLEEIKKLISFKFRKKILQWPKKIFKQQQKSESIKLERVSTSS
ncbi:MAG: patatin-like phospholipase family protein [Desulfobacterales bacterium]|jgi:NTE family protein